MKFHDKSFSDILKELQYLGKLSKKYLSAIIVYTIMAMLSTFFGILASLVSQSLIDFVTGGSISTNLLKFNSFQAVVAAAFAFTLFKILFSAFNSRVSEKIKIKINTEMTANIFDEFICSQWEYTSLYSSGDILNRFNSDIQTVAGSVIGIIPTFVTKGFQFVIAFGIVFYYDRIMALIALITIPLSIIMSRFLVKKMHLYAKELKKINSKMMEFNSDSLTNIQSLKSFGLVSAFCSRLRKLQSEYIRLSLDYNKFSIIVTSLLSFSTQIVTYLCYGWAVFRLWRGEISIGTLILFIELYAMLSGAFSSVLGVVPATINCVAASERISEIRNLPKDDTLEKQDVSEFFENASKHDISIELNSVSFRYKDETEYALKNIDFSGKTGDFIALTGASGEGKTTILRLLLALIECNEGEAVIRDIDSGNVIPIQPATRQFVSYVPQKNSMFSETLAANMRLVKPDATDEEIIEALKIACAYDFVSKERKGIYCKVGDGGVGFSEGQMQRLSIARAVLRDAPVVLLDEATSALDIDTEQQILDNISRWGRNKICIFTTHRATVFGVCNKTYLVTGVDCKSIV